MAKAIATIAIWGACSCAVIFGDASWSVMYFIGAVVGTLFVWG